MELPNVLIDAEAHTVTLDRSVYDGMCRDISDLFDAHDLLRLAASLLVDYLEDPADPEEALRAIQHWIRDHPTVL